MDEPLLLTRQQSRRIDQIAMERYGVAGVVLMENAGRGVVDILLRIDPELGRVHEMHQLPRDDRGVVHFMHPTVGVVCGKGNNAGDGFVIARHLQIRGVAVQALLAFPPEQLTGDARINYEILKRCDVPIVELPAAGLVEALDRHAGGAAWLVDALLGTGAVGEPRKPVASIIGWMNSQPARRLAVDLPSGLDCDTGRPAAATVRGDITCTFVAPKVGMVQPAAGAFVGELHVVSIGVPAGVIREAIDG